VRSANERWRAATGSTGDAFGLANSDNGVSILNFTDMNSTQMRQVLRGGLQRDLEQALPGARMVTGRSSGDYIDYTQRPEGSRFGAISAENQGRGEATSIMLGKLEEMQRLAPRQYENLIRSQHISAKARANLERLIARGGQGQRTDYEELLRLVGEGGIQRLIERTQGPLGFSGLPAFAIAPGVGRGGSGEDRRR
jgi:hypothetical protein